MVRVTFTADDIVKLKRAYEDLNRIIELVDEMNRERGENKKAHSFVRDAHKCLGEVLYGD